MAKNGKKSIFKRWWFWAIVIVVIIAIAAGSGGGGSTDTKTKTEAASDTTDNTSKDTPKEEPDKKASEETNTDDGQSDKKKDSAKVSKEEFKQIKSGMTYDEVVKIIGSEGELMSATGEEGSEFYTQMYSWEGEGSFVANAIFTFQGGELLNKSQMGVGGMGSEAKITLEEFKKIKNGMTFEEVQKIVGGKGKLTSESGDKGSDFHTTIYSYSGEELGANVTLMFQGGELMSKSQFGLK